MIREVDPLRLAARERAGLAAEREVAEADAQQEGQLGRELAQDLAPDRRLPRREAQGFEGGRRAFDREPRELRDGQPRYLHGERGGLEPRARAHGAGGLGAVAREEDAHVQLVAVGLDLLEEAVDAGELAVAVIDERALALAEALPRDIQVHARAPRGADELALIPLARRVRPRLDRAGAEAERAIGDDERLVVLEDVAEALALRAGAQRVVEGEEQRLRPLERGAARPAAELLGERAPRGAHDVHRDPPAALAQRRLQRVHEARAAVGDQHDAIQHDVELGRAERGGRRRRQVHDLAVQADARESSAREGGPHLRRRHARRDRQRKSHEGPRAGVLAQQGVGDGRRRVVAGGGRPAGGAVHPADLRVEQSEVVVDLGRGADGGACGAHGILLLEGHRGTDLLDAVDVGPVDPLEEHPRVRRERLDVAPLALREQRVERQRRLARAGDAGDDGEAIVRDLDRDVLEVVLPGSLDAESRGLRHLRAVLLRWVVYWRCYHGVQMSDAIHVLVVDDDKNVRSLLVAVLSRSPFTVAEAASGGDAMADPAPVGYDVALVGLQLPDHAGLDILRWARDADVDAELIVLTGHADVETAVEAMRLGAYDFITKPWKNPELLEVVAKAAEKKALRRENWALR